MFQERDQGQGPRSGRRGPGSRGGDLGLSSENLGDRLTRGKGDERGSSFSSEIAGLKGSVKSTRQGPELWLWLEFKRTR